MLADIFARMKFMERRGSRLKKITERTNELFNEQLNHVEFYSENTYFRVVIENANHNGGVNNILKKQTNTEIVYELICLHPGARFPMIVDLCRRLAIDITDNIVEKSII